MIRSGPVTGPGLSWHHAPGVGAGPQGNLRLPVVWFRIWGARGLPGIVGGTVYPVLNRLETEGRLSSEWREGSGGPGRKFYSITAAGEAWLR